MVAPAAEEAHPLRIQEQRLQRGGGNAAAPTRQRHPKPQRGRSGSSCKAARTMEWVGGGRVRLPFWAACAPCRLVLRFSPISTPGPFSSEAKGKLETQPEPVGHCTAQGAAGAAAPGPRGDPDVVLLPGLLPHAGAAAVPPDAAAGTAQAGRQRGGRWKGSARSLQTPTAPSPDSSVLFQPAKAAFISQVHAAESTPGDAALPFGAARCRPAPAHELQTWRFGVGDVFSLG